MITKMLYVARSSQKPDGLHGNPIELRSRASPPFGAQPADFIEIMPPSTASDGHHRFCAPVNALHITKIRRLWSGLTHTLGAIKTTVASGDEAQTIIFV